MTDPLLLRIDHLVGYISGVLEGNTKSSQKQKHCRNTTISVNEADSENAKYRDTKWQRDRKKQLDILSCNGLTFRADTNVDPNAERPIGHSTHNLFLKDKKSNQRFLVTHHQSHRMDFKSMTKTLKKNGYKIKELRMDSHRNRKQNVKKYFGFDTGCITALSLLNMKGYDKESGVQWIVDSKLLEMTDTSPITICSGCSDPMDHSQHHVVDIGSTKLVELVQSVGVEPVVVQF